MTDRPKRSNPTPPHLRTLENACLAVMVAEPWVPLSVIAERIGRQANHLSPVFARMLKAGRVQRRVGKGERNAYEWAAPGAV